MPDCGSGEDGSVPFESTNSPTHRGGVVVEELQDWEVEKESGNSEWEIKDGMLVGHGITTIRNNIPFEGNIVVDLMAHSGRSFALHIGSYRFAWFRYQSYYYGSKVRMKAYKEGVSLPGDKAYNNIPVEMIHLRWVKQGNTITWYRGTKKIFQVKEKRVLEKDSTIRLETTGYYYHDDASAPTTSSRSLFSKTDSLLFLGTVNSERLEKFEKLKNAE